MKPQIFYDRTIGRWVADNGHETAVFDRWGLALRFAALRWYGPAGRRWWGHAQMAVMTADERMEDI